MAYVARVSNPNRTLEMPSAKLLRYCLEHKHWSVFESAYMTVFIETSIMVSRQILRHRSFTFQEFSQRYSPVDLKRNFPEVRLRRQDTKNRQNSIDDLSFETKYDYGRRIDTLFNETYDLYNDMLNDGVAKECARAILPLVSPTTLHMTGNCRQWIHYIQLRTENGTQLEHKEVAEGCKGVFVGAFPAVSEALRWD